MTDTDQRPAEEGDLQHELVLAAARERGVEIADVSAEMGCRAAVLEHKGQVELLVKGVMASAMTLKTKHLCDFKELTKRVFRALRIPCPRGVLFSSPDDPAVAEFLVDGPTCVCKPQVAANGLGVEMGITSVEQVRAYWDRCGHLDCAFLLEEQLDGVDLRIQVIGGRIAAACVRVPAHVVGDGEHTLAQLIERRREVMREQNPANRLELDHASHALLEAQGVTLDSVPAEGREVRLKRVANIGQGGHAIDVSDEIHPHYRDWVARVVTFCDASYFALDVVCRDYTEDPETQAVALELNALAEWAHHTFSERRTHDLGRLVIDAAFGS